MSNPFQQYRNSKQVPSDSESETEGPARTSTPKSVSVGTPSDRNMAFNPDQIKAVVEAAVNHALQDSQRRENELRQTIQQLANQVAAMQVAPAPTVTPQIKVYAPIDINNAVICNEPLDAVKCLPEFSGAQETYVSWRQAAVGAYYIFKDFVGSSRHYQAVIIIRSKIRGPADAVLSSFGTVLNFEAIINRLDFTYSDKRTMHVIEQEMGTLRQGSLSLLQYYDEVERKLTLLTNKATMTYEASAAQVLCEKFRDDALRVFISGLKRSLTDVLFAAKPKDMPSALALAQEVEANHDRYTFASSFAKSQEDREKKQFPKAQERQQATAQANSQYSGGKNPHFTKQHKAQVHPALRSERHQGDTPEPMEVDPSLARMLKPSQAPAYQNRKPAASDKTNPQKRQRVNYIAQSADKTGDTYTAAASSAAQEIDDDAINEYDSDAINFLGEDPCYPSSDEE